MLEVFHSAEIPVGARDRCYGQIYVLLTIFIWMLMTSPYYE